MGKVRFNDHRHEPCLSFEVENTEVLKTLAELEKAFHGRAEITVGEDGYDIYPISTEGDPE